MSSSSVSGVVGAGVGVLFRHGATHRRTTRPNKFVLDSGAAFHCTSDVNLLHDLRGIPHRIVHGAAGNAQPVVGCGSIRTPKFSIPEVFFVPGLGLGPGRSIISVSKLIADHDLDVRYSVRGVLVKTRQGKVVGRGHLINGLYILDFLIIGEQDDDDVDDDAASLVARVSQQESSQANARPTDERDSSQELDDDTHVFEQQDVHESSPARVPQQESSQAKEKSANERDSQELDDSTHVFKQQDVDESSVTRVPQQESSQTEAMSVDEPDSQELDDTQVFQKQLELHLVVPPWLLSEVKDLLSPILLILACGYHYLNRKKVVAVFILGLLLWAHNFGALHLVFNTSDNTHGRVLVGINHDTEHEGGDGIISVGLGMTEGNANNSRKDHKALAPWISNQTSDQPVKDYGETTKKQNRTGEPRPPTTNKATETTVVRWIVIASAIFVVVLCCIAFVLWYMCCRSRAQQIDDPEGQVELSIATGPIKFEYYELEVATGNFTHENKLGEGATGFVYRGHLRTLDRHVAIKVMSLSQRLNDFNSEVKVITQLKHKNIVELVGWCRTNEKLLLVYELMAKGSLYSNLYNRGEILSWEQRYNIILDLGSALTYLHENCKEFVFHGDIKPQNVLIDAAYNAKLGDFGTTRLIQHGADPQPTEHVAGTFGYMDPEFMRTGVRCPKADMYSFGVTLIEIACGKRPSSGLLDWIRELYYQSRTLQEPSWIHCAADWKLKGEFDQQQMERVLVTGLLCALPDPSQRPTILKAMDVLRSADGNLPLVPAVPRLQHIRSVERLVDGESSSFGDSAPPSAYHTCNDDSAHLLAGG